MRIDKFTTRSREAIASAQSEATRRGNPELLPEHIVMALLDQEQGVLAALVQKAGADAGAVGTEVTAAVEKLPRVTGGSEPALSRRAANLLQKAEDEAKALKDDFTSVEHLGLAAVKHDRELAALFKRHGIDEAKFMAA